MSKKSGKSGKSSENGQSFEASLKRLEQIVESLESGEVPLDKAVELYEEGVQLSKFCGEKLRDTELRLKKLSKDAEGNFEVSDLES
ncbi:MAG: exodeoxyribonuclease VII small subunit [Ignavibacteriae bacterium]|nr:exodeoxyribonuclease VII small subunit [Ignavibacteriota bacterium]